MANLNGTRMSHLPLQLPHSALIRIFENIDIGIDKDNLKNIDIDIDMVILENIDIDIDIDMDFLEYIDIDIDKGILQNIDIDKISYRLEFGISNRARHPRPIFPLNWTILKK